MADLLGFEAPLLNSYGSIASVDYITGLYSAMKLVFLHLGRLVQDMGYWSAFEVGQLYVPNSLVQISSIMPQKRNPVPIEHLRHLASVTAFRCDMVVNTVHNTPFTDMNDSEGEVQQAGYAAFESGGRALALLAAFLPACRIDAARVCANIDAACVTITELGDTLVRSESVSFRKAHAIAAATARAVIAEARPLASGYAAFRSAFAEVAGRDSTLSPQNFADAVAPETFIARRDRPGGPAPAALEAAFAIYAREVAALRARLDARAARAASAPESLARAFSQLAER
jgi:argininosuccinate lyase